MSNKEALSALYSDLLKEKELKKQQRLIERGTQVSAMETKCPEMEQRAEVANQTEQTQSDVDSLTKAFQHKWNEDCENATSFQNELQYQQGKIDTHKVRKHQEETLLHKKFLEPWICTHCTFLNQIRENECEVCAVPSNAALAKPYYSTSSLSTTSMSRIDNQMFQPLKPWGEEATQELVERQQLLKKFWQT